MRVCYAEPTGVMLLKSIGTAPPKSSYDHESHSFAILKGEGVSRRIFLSLVIGVIYHGELRFVRSSKHVNPVPFPCGPMCRVVAEKSLVVSTKID